MRCNVLPLWQYIGTPPFSKAKLIAGRIDYFIVCDAQTVNDPIHKEVGHSVIATQTAQDDCRELLLSAWLIRSHFDSAGDYPDEELEKRIIPERDAQAQKWSTRHTSILSKYYLLVVQFMVLLKNIATSGTCRWEGVVAYHTLRTPCNV